MVRSRAGRILSECKKEERPFRRTGALDSVILPRSDYSLLLPLLQPDIGQVLGSLIAPGAASVLEHLEAQPSLIAPGAASDFVHVEAQQPAFSLTAPGAAMASPLQHSLDLAQQSLLTAPAATSDFWVLEQPTMRTATSTAESIENVRMSTFSFGPAGTSLAGKQV
jgi:hypothetical protein